ncbi:MAG TPA: hypothetical protein V6C72_09970 [Chroococcales cyanobacterium]
MDSSDPRLNRRAYFLLLSFLLALFCCRVVGQLLVAFWGVPWLPPMEEWFSGVIPYPILLACQVVIIALYGKVCMDLARGSGFFAEPRRVFGKYLTQFGCIYLAVMMARYAIRMSLYPAERWVGGCIPIFFHWILAAFLIILGLFHLASGEKRTRDQRTR